MPDRTLVFLESSTSGHLFVRAARRQGLRPILVTSGSDRYRNLAGEAVDTVIADTADIGAMARVCDKFQAQAPIAGIMSTSGAYASMAARLCHRLGLPGADFQAIENCQNKFLQRGTFKNAGLLTPAYELVHNVPSAVEAAARIGFPVIVKPVVGSGSTGVRLCLDGGDVGEQVAYLLSTDGEGVARDVLIEEFIVGLEYSVETVGHAVLGITKKHLGTLPHFVEVGHDFPAALDQREQFAVTETVLSAVEALRLHWGAAHTELRLDRRGPVIIEVNPRMGGDMIPELIRLASGVDVVSETIRLATGAQIDLRPRKRRQASIRFLTPGAEGLVRWKADLNAVRAIPSVSEVDLYVAEGDEVRLHGDYRDRIGHVIAEGDTQCEVEFSLAEVMAGLRYDIEPAAGPPNGR
ncbi:ATP-grasp domain-containing protein [Neorhizobium galegae]|uniref:ATP-grasp domain-containing protein n=1 Tax=Neorhizobium galegae TaxID=399 RepID=UPI002107D5AA|nr:ATP-grasp domain-containing protein [Neorhizobium galegae]MCQ1854985.1 ATP-grasp domain-containing protein [Neorhizobium galegae]